MTLTEGHHRRGHHLGREILRGGNAQLPLQGLLVGFHLIQQAFQLGKQGGQPGQQPLTGFSQVHLASGAGHQRHTQTLLQPLDGQADLALVAPQPFRRACKAARPGQRQKQGQGIKIVFRFHASLTV